MKKKYWIEAGIVFVLFLAALLYSLPRFFHAQIPPEVKRMDRYVERLCRFFAKDRDVLDELIQYSHTEGVRYQGPRFRLNDGVKVITTPIFFMYRVNWLDLDKLERAFPELSKPEWTHSELRVYVCRIYGKRDGNDSTTKGGYYDKPFAFTVYARVGRELDSKFADMNAIVDVDEEGYYRLVLSYTPFAHTNGLDSYGELYRDSYELWEKEKAVLVDMPKILP